MSSKGKKRKKKKKFIRYFTVSFVLLFSVIAVAYVFSVKGQADNSQNNSVGSGSSSSGNSKDKNTLMDTLFGSKQIKLNVAVFGVDEDKIRTDVMFVGTFDSKTKKIGLISLPRDTKVTMLDEMITEIKAGKGKNGSLPNLKGICKLNEVHARAGKDNRNKYSVMQIEDLLKIKIDYFVKVDIDGFKKLVDVIGGVEVDVPRDMKYDDPTPGYEQKIRLEKGMQHLNGEQAEMLVRWRKDNNGHGYAEGDVGRIETQQIFLKALADKLLNTKTIITKAPELIKIFFDYVETDIGIDDALKYVQYLKDVNIENITMETLPGYSPAYQPGEPSYFINDPTETRILVDKLFYDIGDTQPTKALAEGETISSKDKKIEVLNGGSIGGIAGRTQDKLEADGFTVSSIGTYEGQRQQQTIIIVKEKGLGEDLKKYFIDSEIQIDSTEVSKGTDIKIIIGTKEK